MNDLLRKLRDKEGFSETEKVIADYLMNNFRNLPNLTTRELAKKTFTSSAAIVRFAQKLGFEGYSEFKVRFLADMMRYISEPRENYLSPRDTVPIIMDKIRYLNMNVVQETFNMLDHADVNRAIHLLKQSNHIDFYGTDNNIDLAPTLAAAFVMSNKYISIHQSIPVQYLQAYGAPKDHLGLFLSRTGENRMLIDIAKVLHKQKNPSILITAAPKSTLANLADVVFTTPNTEKIEELGTRIYLKGAIYILDVLVGVLHTHVDFKMSKEKEAWLKEVFFY